MGEQGNYPNVVVRKATIKANCTQALDKPVNHILCNGILQSSASHFSSPSPSCSSCCGFYESYVGQPPQSLQCGHQTTIHKKDRSPVTSWRKLLAPVGICWSKEEALTYILFVGGRGKLFLMGGKTSQPPHVVELV